MSAWGSPCILVGKSDGTFHFCIDYRCVNAVTRPDCYPLPRLYDCIDHMGSAVYLSKFDLLKGYWQIPLMSRAKEISAFATPDDFLSYRVMAFGMRNASATFQRLINTVLSDKPDCDAYLDDVVRIWKSYSNLLRSSRGRGSGASTGCKIVFNLQLSGPADHRELQRFLYMVGYYCGFCKNISSVVAPLADLLSPKVTYQWIEQCQKSFQKHQGTVDFCPCVGCTRVYKTFFPDV